VLVGRDFEKVPALGVFGVVLSDEFLVVAVEAWVVVGAWCVSLIDCLYKAVVTRWCSACTGERDIEH
jgi:hypothetical protein